jgi:hypothetical protein
MKGIDPVVRLAARLPRALWRHIDLFALLLLMLAVCNIGFITSGVPITRGDLNPLDESWQVDLIYKASQGVWSGRDFAFTYGPLWQSLASILPRAAGLSLGSIFKLFYLFPYWAAFVFMFLAARILLRACSAWKRAVFLIAMIVFWLPADARAGLALLSFTLHLRLVEDLPDSAYRLSFRAALATALLAACFLMAGDSGALSVAGLAAVLISYLFTHWRNRADLHKAIRFALHGAAWMLFWALLVNTWAGGPLRYQFWSWSFHMMSSYRWVMAAPMAPEAAFCLARTFAVCVAIFAAAWFTRDPESESLTMRPFFLVAVMLFSCVALQKGLVRSGWLHISHSLLPAISMSGAILVGYRNQRRPILPHLTLLTAVALTLLFSGPSGLFGWSGVVSRVFWTPSSFPSCPPGTRYVDQACLPRREYATFGLPSSYIETHSTAADSLVVYPYENLFGLLSRRRVSTGVLQNYAIGGKYLTDLQLSTLERERPQLGVYCADDLVSWPVDGISNFQRTAAVWFYLQSRYVTEKEYSSGVVILRRNETRHQDCSRTTRQVWRGPRVFQSANSPVLNIDPQIWRSAKPDFVRCRVRIQYPAWWMLTKPSSVSAVLQFAGGTAKTTRLLIEPNQLVDVWIYPFEEVNLKNYFRRDESEWRPDQSLRPVLTGIQLRTAPFDQISATPSWIRLDSIDAASLSLRNGQGSP